MELKRRGKTLTIASSRSHASLAEYIENLGLSDIISYILGADDVKEGKPNPEAIFKTLERFDFDTDEAIMIGDTVFDINMGINAGVKTCGVTYGNGSRESLSDADWVIDDFGSLLELIG
jgi:HAD superfamily hydrolase (TIGR01549 family)